MTEIKFIDLFAGLGATRIGFEQACNELNIKPRCVFTSEIKEYAVSAYESYFSSDHRVSGDITQIDTKDIPDFDILLGGFPCQSFSSAGARKGFQDTRGTMFFEIERILREKKPYGFLLENVEGLINHDKAKSSDKIGRTLETILNILNEIGYKVTWKLLNSKDFGVPQKRKRIYIVGTREKMPNLDNLPLYKEKYIGNILEKGKPLINNDFSKNLLSKFNPEQLYNKAIKDKRGGSENIHSRDLELKGSVTNQQRQILNEILKERRKKHWALKKGITRMDGMPLSLDEIYSFYKSLDGNITKPHLRTLLNDLVNKGYLVFEHPKGIISKTDESGNVLKSRSFHEGAEKGYNIVAGKLSFPITKILDPNGYAPTIVATEVGKIAVVDGYGIRNLTTIEGKRLFGIPDDYDIEFLSYQKAFDLLGNTVVVPAIKEVSKRLLS